MSINLRSLLVAAQGDPEGKVAVKRAWLGEVYRMLVEGQLAKDELERLKAQIAYEQDPLSDPEIRKSFDESMSTIDAGMDKMFGKGGAFDKIFGGKRKLK